MVILKVFFKTFGCRTNIFDTQVMISSIGDYKLANNESEADVIVINSCTVTNGADKDVKDYISKIKKQQKKILFTGCGLQGVGKHAYESGSIFGAFGHNSKQEIRKFIDSKERFYVENNFIHLDSTIISEFVGKSRAFIKIQEGCNFACSYCIIPQVRGKARSYAKEQILLQISKLADSGVSEVVLTGTNLGSYGKDTNDTLSKLIIDISNIRGIKRIRLGSLEPSQIKDDFLELLDSSFLAKQLHIALQYTQDDILKSMNRINRFSKDLELFSKIADKGFALGTDFIVGYPLENDEIFKVALNNLKLLPLTHVHAFIYSPRVNTKAALLQNNISKQVSKDRLNIVKNIVAQNNYHFRAKKPKIHVLVETKKRGFYYGLDEYFNRIKIKSEQNLGHKWLELSDYKVLEEINYAEI